METIQTPSAAPEAVLVVDDNDDDRKFLADILEQDGFAVRSARSGWEASEFIVASRFDLVVTDLVMPGMSGFEVIAAAHKSNPESICIAMTSFGSLDSAMDALRMGAYSYLAKPCDPGEFRHCIRRGLEKQRLTKELRLRNQELERLNAELDAKVQEATSELRELNGRMLTEMASLQEVDRLKSAFLDNVSHDLKNPLTTIQVYLDMLLENAPLDLSEQWEACFQSVRRSVTHMEYLISQLLEAAQLTSGKIRLDVRPLSVSELLDEAAALAKAQAETHGLRLEVRCDSSAPILLHADRGRLLQALNNLLGNACKFTPKGGKVALRAWLEDSAVHFCVEDTGPGIAPEHHARIFERFYQVDQSLAKMFKGLGLGLRIARDLVELHGGAIWVESDVGKGSRFHFTIPGRPKGLPPYSVKEESSPA